MPYLLTVRILVLQHCPKIYAGNGQLYVRIPHEDENNGSNSDEEGSGIEDAKSESDGDDEPHLGMCILMTERPRDDLEFVLVLIRTGDAVVA